MRTLSDHEGGKRPHRADPSVQESDTHSERSTVPAVKIQGISSEDVVAVDRGTDRDIDREDCDPQNDDTVRLNGIGKILSACGTVISAALNTVTSSGRIADDARKPDLGPVAARQEPASFLQRGAYQSCRDTVQRSGTSDTRQLSGQRLQDDSRSSQSLGDSAGTQFFTPKRGPVSRQKSKPSNQQPTDWKTLSAPELQRKPKTSGFSVAWRKEDGESDADAYSTGAASSSSVELRALDAAIHTAFELCQKRRKGRALLVSDSLDAIRYILGTEQDVFEDATDGSLWFARRNPHRARSGFNWIHFDITWIRSHEDCAGNCVADGVAKYASRTSDEAWRAGLFNQPRQYWSRRNVGDAARDAELRLAAKQQEVTTTGPDEVDFLASTTVSNEQPPQLPSNITGQAIMVADSGVAKRAMSKTFITQEMQQAGLEATIPKLQDDDAGGSGGIGRGGGSSNGSESRKKRKAESDGVLCDSGDDGSVHPTSKKSRRSAFSG
ncbi:hypothetical protein LTR86_004367 [Recurvomyces mirabilis]|nr:hypothetical protein LTR86_004367 [Recurvomyces mirabilis]